MLLTKDEKEGLLNWAKRHRYASNSLISIVARFNDRILIDVGFHTILDNIRVRVDRKASRFSRWLLGPYDWKEISFDEDGPWWDTIRKELPILIKKDELNDLNAHYKRELELSKMAEEYTE